MLRTDENLIRIRTVWLARAAHRLARGEGLRESFLDQLQRFYELLAQVVETGDAAWLDPIIMEWVQAGTLTELEHRRISLAPILHEMLICLQETAHELLTDQEAVQVIGAVLPGFLHASELASQQEMQIYLDCLSEDVQKANSALQRLDKTKSDFIAVAAHELKTPLTLIEGYTAMLRETLSPDELQGSTEVFLLGIDTGNRRLREIVDDMIDVSLIDNQLLQINFQPIWIDRLLTAIYKDVSSFAEERHQKLEIRKFEGSDEMTYGDGERLLQALRNVISNAIKYTPDGGSIYVDGRKLPGFVEIIVKDTGIGVAPENLTRIFEKFGQVGNAALHSSSKTNFKGGGPGLGLPITKGIIEAHGGAIWVESEGFDEKACPGSTFHVLLPIRTEPPPAGRAVKLIQGNI